MNDYTKVFGFVRFSLENEDFSALLNGNDNSLKTELSNKDGVIEEPSEHKNVFKINVCTDESSCPNSSLEEETLIPNV